MPKRSKKKANGQREQVRRQKQSSEARKDGSGLFEQLRARVDMADKPTHELLRLAEEEFLKMFERVAEMYAINIRVQKTNDELATELKSIQSQIASIGSTS